MKKKFTVSEMAQFSCVTVDTLKHYDRIGLFKPDIVDENTSYRYYHLDQYSDIVLIRDLRNIGFSIPDIKKYLQHRNIDNSLAMLKTRKKELLDEIETLTLQTKNISNVINRIQQYNFNFFDSLDFQSKVFQERKVFTFYENMGNVEQLKVGFIHIENALCTRTFGLIDTVYGAYIKNADLINKKITGNAQLFSFVNYNDEENISEENIAVLPEGKYACKGYRGSFWQNGKYFIELMQTLENQAIEIDGPGIIICGLDSIAVDNPDEYFYEIQIKIK